MGAGQPGEFDEIDVIHAWKRESARMIRPWEIHPALPRQRIRV
jgi:hypothetical protein